MVPDQQGRGVQVGDILLLIYVLGCFLSLVPIARFFATDFGEASVKHADTEALVFGVAMGLCLCWAWPLGIIAVPVYYAVKHWE